jgi:hypothetical protein
MVGVRLGLEVGFKVGDLVALGVVLVGVVDTGAVQEISSPVEIISKTIRFEIRNSTSRSQRYRDLGLVAIITHLLGSRCMSRITSTQ